MKPSQRTVYAGRIDKVVAHLEAVRFESSAPTLTELADVAGMSEFHFHRIFRLMTGETVGEALRRIRLARTLPALAGDESVTRAAADSGYATPQGFARALRRQAGTSARFARASAETFEALVAGLRAPPPQDPAPAIAVEIVSVAPFRLLALRNVGDYAELNAGYQRLFERVLAQMPPGSLQGIYGIPHDDPRVTPAEDCRFDCALAVEAAGQAASDLFELTLGGGAHARLRHLGDYDALPASIDLLYAGAIVVLDRALGSAPLFVHYLDDPEEVAVADLRADIYLPLAG